MTWLRYHRNGIYGWWFATWLFLGPVLLSFAGQKQAASFMSDWRLVVIPVSAGLLYWGHHYDEDGGQAHALSLGFLLFVAFYLLHHGPDPGDPRCVPDEDSSCLSGNTVFALMTAGSAAILTFHRPIEEHLRSRAWWRFDLRPVSVENLNSIEVGERTLLALADGDWHGARDVFVAADTGKTERGPSYWLDALHRHRFVERNPPEPARYGTDELAQVWRLVSNEPHREILSRIMSEWK